MAITVNKNTTQKPLTAAGVTGQQVIKFIPAPRIYMKATPDSTSAAVIPSVKSNGATPTGYSDLGSVAGMAKLGYSKKTTEVKTGIDNYLRAAYVSDKTGTIEFSLSEVDDTAIGLISGLTPSVISASSIYTFHMGQEDLNQICLLLVTQNKLDGKEIQWYSPLVYANFDFQENGDALELHCVATLPFFTAQTQTAEEILACTIFA